MRFYWALVAITGALYCAMLFWTLPYLVLQADGLAPFDVRPLGYSFAQVQEYLTKISPEGVLFYLHRQHVLDAAFPALLGAVLAIALWKLTARWALLLRIGAVALPILGGGFDYLENLAVRNMLHLGATDVEANLAAYASTCTVTKAAFITSAMTLLIVLAVFGYFKRRHKGIAG